ncbi:MAG: hypothetical protein KBT13_12250 [Bacteroidales bacterium]|uniref:hypothetical protein n=1 Tax=Sodaliphilus sp. TaxID=2815818 RepID=UPI001B424F1D|nr:hypothetical protein [Candidatus Sodaliphilus limicaballi]
MTDDFNDHFMEDGKRKEEPEHVETPDEREDREIEESTISHRHNTVHTIIYAAIALVSIGFATWVWFHYYHPYAQRVEKGWIMDVSNEGAIFKTIECKVITQDLVLDTMKVKWNKDTMLVDGCNFAVSIGDDSLAIEAVKWKGSGKRVLITYDEYSGSLPWRGGTNRVATGICLDTLTVE